MNRRNFNRKRKLTYAYTFVLANLICLLTTLVLIFSCNKVSNREIIIAKEYAFKLYNEGLHKFCDYASIKKMELEFTDNEDLNRFFNDGLKFVYHDDLERFRITGDYVWDTIEFNEGTLKFHDKFKPTYIEISTHLYCEDDMKFYLYREHVNFWYLISVILVSVIIASIIWYSYTKNKIDERFDNYIIKDYDEDEPDDEAYENDEENYEDYEDDENDAEYDPEIYYEEDVSEEEQYAEPIIIDSETTD